MQGQVCAKSEAKRNWLTEALGDLEDKEFLQVPCAGADLRIGFESRDRI
jgi:hypothetical protein